MSKSLSESKPSQPERGNYSEVEVGKGLAALAMFSGNASRASRELERVGLCIPRRTLGDWKRLHADRYRAIQQEIQPEINAEVAETAERLVRRLAEVEWQLIDKIESELPGMNGTQAGTALQRVTWSKGVNADKSRVFRDLPTEIKRDVMSFPEALKAIKTLSQKYPGIFEDPRVVEGEAIEESEG